MTIVGANGWLRTNSAHESPWRRDFLTASGRYGEAEPLLLKSYERTLERPDLTQRRGSLERLVRLYQAWGKPEKGEVYASLLARLPAPALTPRSGRRAP